MSNRRGNFGESSTNHQNDQELNSLNPNAVEFVPREFSNSNYYRQRGGGNRRGGGGNRGGRSFYNHQYQYAENYYSDRNYPPQYDNVDFDRGGGGGGSRRGNGGRGGGQQRQQNNPTARRSNNSEATTSSGNDNLRVSISDRLSNETYECMICCDRIRWDSAVWSCQLCYSVFHLRCAKRWANSCAAGAQDDPHGTNRSNQTDGEWRCPGCQTQNPSIPNEYKCFCGKMRNPSQASWSDRGNASVPHTCGELCQKRRGSNCPHPCNDLCHPGPCDSCPLTVDKKCRCGKESRRVRCGTEPFQCGQMCGKLLTCGIHECQSICHDGECSKCDEKIRQACFCGQSERAVSCGDRATINGEKYSCGIVCQKFHKCGIHRCEKPCHPGGDDCGPCPFDPETITTCCCGKFSLDELSIDRRSCADSLPVCKNICGKKLKCGEDGNHHKCQSLCHPGPCPECPLSTSIRCRCGATTKNVPCEEVTKYGADHPFLCERRCTKKRTCKQHKCGELCCVDADHICAQICGRKLNCGVHTCDTLCHHGKCPPCLHASFEELTCLCGTTVIYPPVRCGTKPPACDRLCTRQHPCAHPVVHQCHSEPNCPPCTYLTAKWCYGKHELRKNIPCYLEGISCGMPCGQPLSCGQHLCNRSCHDGPCQPTDGQQQECAQPCVRPRANCEHPCAVKCHGDAPCPEKVCQFVVRVTCKCGHESEKMMCYEIDRLLAQRFMGKVNKAADGKHEVDLGELTRQDSMERYKCLICTDECARVERNRQFAEALEVRTEDYVGEFGPPAYTDFLKEQFKLASDFVLSLEKTLVDLVSSTEKSKTPTRSHVFPPMTRNQRHIVHEYAACFEVDTVAYDQEPKRNVVATAKRGKSKIPHILLSTVVQKENSKTPRVVPPKANHVDIGQSDSAGLKTLQSSSGTILRR